MKQAFLSTDPLYDEALRSVFDVYHQRMHAERTEPRIEVPGGRDGGLDQRMRAIGPETGRLLHAIVGSLETPRVLEVGTSFGYSTLWLADAARSAGGHVDTLELHDYKSAHAKQMAERAGLSQTITFWTGDALALIPELSGRFDFVFIDLWKDLYLPVLESLKNRLNQGAILVADNMGRSSEEIRSYGRAVRALPAACACRLATGWR